MLSLKLIAAAIVRDFLVVEDRESLFHARPFRRRIRGENVKTVIYLPRVRYSKPVPTRLHIEEDTRVRARHEVAPHLRRAAKASPEQRFLAQRYGMTLPKGYTFVRAHQRGTEAESARLRLYRSRSASRMIFDEIERAPQGARPAWFDFEKDCARLLRSRGVRVVHQAANGRGDGGVDLFAINDTGDSWLVQCKCWAPDRPVGPDVIRELHGAIRLAEAGAERKSRGILITTSTFTSGAVASASELGIELIDGKTFAKQLKALPH